MGLVRGEPPAPLELPMRERVGGRLETALPFCHGPEGRCPRSGVHRRRRSSGRSREHPVRGGRLAARSTWPRPRRRSRPGGARFSTWSGARRPGGAHAGRRAASTTCATWACPAQYPFTRGVQPTMYREQALDDAHVRRLRHARADERALQVPARAGADRPLDRLRFPDPHGLRPRLAALARRGRACAASRSTRCATWRSSSTASRSTRSRRR